MNSFSTVVCFTIAAAYIVWPGFFSDLGKITELAMKQLGLDVRRQIMMWQMKRQLDKDRAQLEKWLNEYQKEIQDSDDVVQ